MRGEEIIVITYICDNCKKTESIETRNKNAAPAFNNEYSIIEKQFRLKGWYHWTYDKAQEYCPDCAPEMKKMEFDFKSDDILEFAEKK